MLFGENFDRDFATARGVGGPVYATMLPWAISAQITYRLMSVRCSSHYSMILTAELAIRAGVTTKGTTLPSTFGA